MLQLLLKIRDIFLVVDRFLCLGVDRFRGITFADSTVQTTAATGGINLGDVFSVANVQDVSWSGSYPYPGSWTITFRPVNTYIASAVSIYVENADGSSADVTGPAVATAINKVTDGTVGGGTVVLTSVNTYTGGTNLGAGTNGTEVLFLNFSECIIGDSMTLSFATSTEASYWTGSAYVSAFATDQTLMRSISEHDFAPMHDVAIAMLTGTAWAA